MKWETFENLVATLYNSKVERYENFNKNPSNYRTMILDDEYVESVLNENDLLLKHIFGKHYLDIIWFLWDWKPGFSVTENNITYVINDLNDFLKFKSDNWNG